MTRWVLLFSLVSAGASGQALEGLAAEALAEENATWQAEVDGDVDAFVSRLAADFVQLTTEPNGAPSIMNGRQAAAASIEEALAAMAFGDFELQSPHARVLGTTVILSYRFKQEYLPRSGEPPTSVEGVATSIWSKDSGKWQNVHFHWFSQPSGED